MSTGTHSGQPVGRETGSGVPGPRDRSYEAVQRQIKGMACECYEILLVDAQGQAKQQRDWSETQLLESVPWLKRMNARGHDVLIRPSRQSGLALLDPLSQADIAKLERVEVPCAAKIEVEPDLLQVWLRLGNAAVSNKVREGIEKYLGLPKSESDKFGALAGFVKHRSTATGERNKFALAHEPVRPRPAAAAKWERVLEDAKGFVKAQKRDNKMTRDKGFSR